MIDWVKNYSINARRMKKSAIREILKLTNRPEIISFAGGLPAPETFPIDEVIDIVDTVMKREGKKALQYGPTDGYPAFVDQLIKWEKKMNGLDLTAANILPTTSSQQALDLIAKILVDPSDPVIVERPTYLGGLSAFNQYGARFVGVPMDEDGTGLNVSDLEVKLQELKDDGEHYKFVYVVPDFQNPSGITISQEKRKRILELSDEYKFVLLEDSPYRELRFEGEAPDMMYKMDTSGNVVTLHTMSKTFAPGFRIGWVVGPEEFIDKLNTAKQASDLCTPSFTQSITAEFMARGLLEKNIERARILYKKKKHLMIDALEQFMPQHEHINWTNPEGGLFLWITLPEYFDTDKMFFEAVDKKVAYIKGSAFDCYHKMKNTMRMNFSYPSEEQIEVGMKRLADLIKSKLKD